MTDYSSHPLAIQNKALQYQLEAANAALILAKGRLMEASDLYLMGHPHNAMAITREVAVEIGKFLHGGAA